MKNPDAIKIAALFPKPKTAVDDGLRLSEARAGVNNTDESVVAVVHKEPTTRCAANRYRGRPNHKVARDVMRRALRGE